MRVRKGYSLMQKMLIILVTALIGFGVAYWDIIAPPSGERLAVSAKRTPAPDFTFTDLNGNAHRLSDFKGKTVLINVWATWCPPCVYEIPQLTELARRNADHMTLIALSVDDALGDITTFLDRLPSDVRANIAADNILFVHDADKAISKGMLDITMYPETLVVDKDGNIQTKITGVDDWLGAEIAAMIRD
tara:strand:+ start:444 stop:1013 length:570 start_codon:yes stop_codon:yes gene_type:complete